MKSYPTLEIKTPSGQRFSLEAHPYSWQLMCHDPFTNETAHLSFAKKQLDALADFITRMRKPDACKPARTCVQCGYFDMWDSSCANIDNAHPDMSRHLVNTDTPACKHFTPEQ
jgi:hypothetical protein